MAKTYTTVAGDTLEKISLRQYGVPTESALIFAANPQAVQPYIEGTILKIPPNPNIPPLSVSDFKRRKVTNNIVQLFVDGDEYQAWSDLKITSQIDSISTFNFTTPHEPSDKRQRAIFTPFKFKPMAVIVGGEFLFSGLIVPIRPTVDDVRRSLSVGGYSRAGLLNDCGASVNAFPLEFDQVGLFEITKKLAFPYGVRVEFEADQGKAFDKVALDPKKKILPFLGELAIQRNGIFGDNPEGALVFRQAVKFGSPIAKFKKGFPPVLSIVPNFDEQKYFSEISGIAATGFGGQGSTYTTKNPFLDVPRIMNFKPKDVGDGDLKTAVDAKMGLMFANAVSWQISIATWRDPQGDIFRPNTTCLVHDENSMIYEETEMLIKKVELSKDGNAESATLEVVLEGSYSGTIPNRLPWS